MNEMTVSCIFEKVSSQHDVKGYFSSATALFFLQHYRRFFVMKSHFNTLKETMFLLKHNF